MWSGDPIIITVDSFVEYVEVEPGKWANVPKVRSFKCPRCWCWHHIEMQHDNLCDRCCEFFRTTDPMHYAKPTMTPDQIEAHCADWKAYLELIRDSKRKQALAFRN